MVSAGRGHRQRQRRARGGTQAQVTGIDYVPDLLDRARRRAEAEELEARFELADAEELPFLDASFDAVLSSIGVMFAPNHRSAASELCRVCRSGGKIGLACWTADGLIGDFFAVHARYMPPSGASEPPLLWGDEQHLADLFGDRVTDLHVARRGQPLRFRSPADAAHWYQAHFGPTVRTVQALSYADRARFMRDFEELFRSRNVSGDDTLLVMAEDLEVVAVRA